MQRAHGKQEMEVEMETEMENWNRNAWRYMVVSIH